MDPRSVGDLIKDVMTYAILFSNFIVMLLMWVGKARAPEESQNERIKSLEDWRSKVDERLEAGNDHFAKIDEGNRVTQKALLALMRHAINGNDIDKLKNARDALEEYITNN